MIDQTKENLKPGEVWMILQEMFDIPEGWSKVVITVELGLLPTVYVKYNPRRENCKLPGDDK